MGDKQLRKYLLPGFLLLLDMVILGSAVWLAYIIRFPDLTEYMKYAPEMLANLPVYFLCNFLFFFLFRLYNRVWKYAGHREALSVVLANVFGTGMFVMVMSISGINVPRSIYFLTFFLATAGVLVNRGILHHVLNMPDNQEISVTKLRVLIVGAGDAGNLILEDLAHSKNRTVVGFMDADPAKIGKLVNGVPVLGDRNVIKDVVKTYAIDEIIIAIPSMPLKELREVADYCSQTKVPVRILPKYFSQLVSPEIKISDLRPLAIEDLLEREPIVCDEQAIGAYLRNKVVMVTGAGGSIGSELCRKIMSFSPALLILLGRGENSIYEIHQELLRTYDKKLLRPVIMNVTNKDGMNAIFQKYQPQVVFHAAAHKHVPLMEQEPQEALFNNVYGTYYTADLAGKYGVERFVMISTDKAVNPTSVMGATKRMAEKVIQAINKKYKDTIFVAVRFGNVLGSRGSVVPLFKRQIAAGGPVTITDPRMVRFFMTIPEAAQLVIQAAALGQGGEVFALDMGKPVKILDLAYKMIRLSGLEPETDIAIKITGLRPGEKLYEEVLTDKENNCATQHAKIFRALLRDEDPEEIRTKIHDLQYSFSGTTEEFIAQMQTIVENYHPNHFTD
jgi:FlaA1/EpsC-like NDP-sugar epimerase